MERDPATIKFETIPEDLEQEKFVEGIAREIKMTVEEVKENMYVFTRRRAKTRGRCTVIGKLKGELVDWVLKKKEFFMG